MKTLLVGACICGVVFLYIGVPWLYSKWLRLLLKIRVTKIGALVLTFDDGPGKKLTPIILDMLDKHKVKATFFLVGANIKGREKIVKQISSRGHEVCSHGFEHIDHWKVSPFRAIRDISQGWNSMDEALGANKKKYPYRPPYGRLNLVSLLYLISHKVPIIYWTFDMGHTWPPKRCTSKRLALLSEQTRGAVALAHDFDHTNEDVNKIVLKSVRIALAQAKEKRMPVLTISQLLDNHNQ